MGEDKYIEEESRDSIAEPEQAEEMLGWSRGAAMGRGVMEARGSEEEGWWGRSEGGWLDKSEREGTSCSQDPRSWENVWLEPSEREIIGAFEDVNDRDEMDLDVLGEV